MTEAEAREAEVWMRQKCERGRPLLRLDVTRATDREREIFARAQKAADFGQVLVDPVVNSMFQRGIMFFAVPA